jgi:type IX secretion system PorP/SprF family membrane protein
MTNFKKWGLLSFVVLSWGRSSAQSTPPQYSLLQQNIYVTNPAVAGLSGMLEAVGVFRQQWLGLEGNPTTQLFNATLPIPYLGGGTGVLLQNDVIGARQSLTAKASFNKIFTVGNGQFSVGASAGWLQMRLDGAKLRTPDGQYDGAAGINHRDQILGNQVVSGNSILLDAGVFFQNDRFSAGVSSQNLNAPTFDFVGTKANFTLRRNYFANFGYNINIGTAVRLIPSVLLRSDGVQTQTEWALTARWKENYFVGSSYRDLDFKNPQALSVFLGLKIAESWTLAYAHDLTLSALANVQRNTNEIMLKYTLQKSFGRGKMPPIIYNPRF